MKVSPLIIGLLAGLIVILVIGGVSLLVKMNSLIRDRDKELAEKRNYELIAENLKEENKNLSRSINELNSETAVLRDENEKLEKLNERLQENLKEELMKRRPVAR